MSNYDVVIIGAGISGINAAYRIKTNFPEFKYAILEARNGIGGTWDFFKYPGLRSDSDLHTFGFTWRPWSEAKAIASGESIAKYIKDTAAEEGIDKHVKFNHKVVESNWSSEAQEWRLKADNEGKTKNFTARFIILASGYYDYEHPLNATIPGLENFKGKTVHPQFWDEKLDYTGKKMVIIGSGATAVTLLPVLCEKAESVVMLQRSPGYVMARPAVDPVGAFLKRWLPISIAAKIIRFQFLVLPFLFFNFCRRWPQAARRIIRKRTTLLLPKTIPHDPHFDPSYNPWEQRMCLCPDGDFYDALHSGKGNVSTGRIKTCTEKSIILESGEELEADIIVTATGLKMQLAGGAKTLVDGKEIKINEKFLWRGVMLQDLPNAAVVIGYTNASWTLGADATAMLVCRLIKDLKARGAKSCMPRMRGPEPEEVSVMNLQSTYVKAATSILPRAGATGPWKPRSNYFKDWYTAKFGDITTGLEFNV